MVHTVVIHLQNPDMDLNSYENRVFASRSTTFMLYLSFTLYRQLLLIKSISFGQRLIL